MYFCLTDAYKNNLIMVIRITQRTYFKLYHSSAGVFNWSQGPPF